MHLAKDLGLRAPLLLFMAAGSSAEVESPWQLLSFEEEVGSEKGASPTQAE